MKSKTDTDKRSQQTELVEDIANEVKPQTSNGNRCTTDSTKTGGAQRGGPGISQAKKRQPPDAKRVHH